MLRFFRKMRQALIPENRFGRYLFYAIGEIILVVIGILIALQVNNWNEHRKQRNEEHIILTALLEDLNSAQIQSERAIGNEDKAISYLKAVLKSRPERDSFFRQTNPDAVLYQIFWNFEVDVPVIHSYTDLKNSGKIDFISNADIRRRFTNIEMGINNLTNLIQDRSTVQQIRIDGVVVNELNFLRLLKTDSPDIDMVLGEENNYNELFENQKLRNLVGMKLELTNSVYSFRVQLEKDIQVLIDLIRNEIDIEN